MPNGHTPQSDAARDAATQRKLARFLDAFARIGSARKAAKAVRMSTSTVYTARRTDPEFAAAWERIVDAQIDEVEASLYQQAIGVKVEAVRLALPRTVCHLLWPWQGFRPVARSAAPDRADGRQRQVSRTARRPRRDDRGDDRVGDALRREAAALAAVHARTPGGLRGAPRVLFCDDRSGGWALGEGGPPCPHNHLKSPNLRSQLRYL
jgi:hypothetical protein